MDGGPESRGVRRVYGLEGAVRRTACTAPYKPYTRCRQRLSGPPPFYKLGKPYAATLTSSAPDDGRKRPKHVELKKLQ